jgi:general stress protein YciG
MDKAEAGRLGGIETKRNFGLDKCPTCGAIKISGFYADNGAKGGKTTVLLHGREHMSKIGKMGGRPRNI